MEIRTKHLRASFETGFSPPASDPVFTAKDLTTIAAWFLTLRITGAPLPCESSFSQLGLEPNHTGLTAQSLFFVVIFIQRSAGQADSIVQQTNNFNQRRKGNLGRQNCSNREAWIHLQTKHSQDMFYLHSQVSRMGKSTACLLQYVLRPRRGLSQASPSLEAPRLQAAGIGDLFQKGKIVMIMWKFGERSTFFLWHGRSRSKARSLHEKKLLLRKFLHGHKSLVREVQCTEPPWTYLNTFKPILEQCMCMWTVR